MDWTDGQINNKDEGTEIMLLFLKNMASYSERDDFYVIAPQKGGFLLSEVIMAPEYECKSLFRAP
ncbi:hypothetical protein DT065_06990 [Salicibibacter kimchii]|uniref:Uncharacterized protein n=1 Tax=Salicibibacter kimchii TaxID=2099786 RepID=A0A345BXW5_9BACI|nr:hypothetical protein DT065_06990 [Salicibibacter kimchii]